MNFWNRFLSKSVGDIVENNNLAFSLPYPQNPRETVLFFGADSSGSISRLDESFLKASLEWTKHLTENGTWELDWDFSVYDFSAGAMQKYQAGKHIQPTASENGIIGLVNSESMESIEKRLISNPRTKLIFAPWFSNIVNVGVDLQAAAGRGRPRMKWGLVETSCCKSARTTG